MEILRDVVEVWYASGSVQVQKRRFRIRPLGPENVPAGPRRHRCVIFAAFGVRNTDDGRVVDDEGTPNLLERVDEASAGRFGAYGPEGVEVIAVIRRRDAELIFPGLRKGRSKPVRRAIKRRLRKDVEEALLLAGR